MMSPGINSGHGGTGTGTHRTGTVPKVKCHNHNDVAHSHDGSSQHHFAGGPLHCSSALLLCNSKTCRSSTPPNLQRREFGFSHVNNNLVSSMDWQPMGDIAAQSASSQQSSRIRKESNTSTALASYDMPDVGSCCGSSSENGNGAAGAGAGEEISSAGVVAPLVDNNGLGGVFYDVPLQNGSNHASGGSDSGELNNQLRWDQEGSLAGVNSARRQQKSNNLCEQAQVASRLHQIRDYISQTSNVMERLQAAGTPQHLEIWLRLHDMLEGLRDSETKLSAIMNTYDRLKALENRIDNDDYNNDDDDDDSRENDSNVEGNQNQSDSVPKCSGDAMTRRNELKVKVEESQRKLMELREQQAALLALKQKAQEQLKEARAAQGTLLVAQEQRDDGINVEDCNQLGERLHCLHHFYELAQSVGCGSDSTAGEVVQLQNKLEELQTKKMQIDQMVARFDVSNSVPFCQPTIPVESTGPNSNSHNNIGSNNNNNNCNSNNHNSQGLTSTEDKIAELSALKEQLARMQSALVSISKSAASRISSNNSTVSSFGSAVLHNSQESEECLEDDDNEIANVHSSSISFKQDNRAQAAISQNHHVHQPAAQHQQSTVTTPVVSSLGDTERDTDCSITPSSVVQQQLYAKSQKLQEAKAKLHHLQELLNLVEEFRGAGKPVPEKILLLLNSPNGPLSDDDGLDLGEPRPVDLQNQPIQTSSSSSCSSLISLFHPQTNNNCSGAIFAPNTFNSTSVTKDGDKDTTVIFHQQPSSNRSSDIRSGCIQNLYQPSTVVSPAQPQQNSLQLHHHLQHPQQLLQPQQPPAIIAKQKNNATKGLCAKTQELEEWMRKDDDPRSCINTDVNLQQQQLQATGGYRSTSLQVHQDVSNVPVTLGHSPDYSSDEADRSEDDHENYTYSERKAPDSHLTRENTLTATMASRVEGGIGGGCRTNSATSIPLSAGIPNTNFKDHLSAGHSSSTDHTNFSREIPGEIGGGMSISRATLPSASMMTTTAVNSALFSGSGDGSGVVGSQSCGASVSNPVPCKLWRKHSAGSSTSLPAYPVNNTSRGMAVSSHNTWTPTCYCCPSNRRDGSNTAKGEEMCPSDDISLVTHSSNLHQHPHPLDNNTNWIVHQISQLQVQLQQMFQMVAGTNPRGTLTSSPLSSSVLLPPAHTSSSPLPSSSPCCQQRLVPPPAAVTPPPPLLTSSPISAGSGCSHYFGNTHQHQKQHYQQLLYASLNQCCQLIWHQQCELASFKETLHDIQQQIRSSSHCAGGNIAEEQCNVNSSHSNLERFDPSHSQSPSHHRQNETVIAEPQLSSSPSSPQQPPPPPPPAITLPPPVPHYFCPPYGNNLNLSFEPFRHSNPEGSFVPSSTGTLNNQVPPGNRANNYWDNFRSYSRQNLLSTSRSKCNEGRSSMSASGSVGADCNSSSSSILNDRHRIGSTNSGSRYTREVHVPWSNENGNVVASASITDAPSCWLTSGGSSTEDGGVPFMTTLLPRQQINALNTVNVNSGRDEAVTRNLENHKEKLNTYQGHLQLFPPPGIGVNSNQLPPASTSLSFPSRSLSQPIIMRAEHREKQRKPSTRDNPSSSSPSSSLKCDASKEACKKSCCRLKEQLHLSENRNLIGTGLCDLSSSSPNPNIVAANNSNNNYSSIYSNITTTSNTSSSNNNAQNNTSDSSRLWNCNNGNGIPSNSLADRTSVAEMSTVNNRHQLPQVQSATGVTIRSSTVNTDDLPRNSNCKRRLVMSSSSATNRNNCNNLVNNKCKPSANIRTESNDLVVDSLEETMYSEVAALISVNEQRPSYLLQLFKDLKQISSDHDRQTALLAIHNLAARSSSSATAASVTSRTSSMTPPVAGSFSSLYTEDQQQQNKGSSVETGDDNNTDITNGSHNIYVQSNIANANDVTSSGSGVERFHNHRRQQQHQPRNIPWRCSKEPSSSVLPVNCRKLDWEVKSILVDMLPFLKSHISEICTPSLLESVRSLVLQLVPSSHNIPGQLDALLEDALFKFQGCRMQDVYDELVSVVADVLISELTFLRLVTSVNSSTPVPDSRSQSDFCAEVDEDVEDEEHTFKEEGAVGGVDQPHDNYRLKIHSNNDRHQNSSAIIDIGCSASKSDPVISDAELAEADQSGRHSDSIAGSTTSSGTITEAQPQVTATRVTEGCKDVHNRHGDVADVSLSSSVPVPIVTSDNNVSVVYDNIDNRGESSNHHRRTSPTTTDHLSSSIVCIGPAAVNGASTIKNVINDWAVEQDREQMDRAPACLGFNSSVANEYEYEQQPTDNNNDVTVTANGFCPSNNTSNSSTDGNTVAAV